ncbi:unnamed protein product [Adineta ricciae]|nr:unnamed protein product [Adineta ricciae]
MYTQLIREILVEPEDDKQFIQEFTDYCQKSPNATKSNPYEVNDFGDNYKPKEKPIWWYTKQIFIYGLVNKALREQQFDMIIRLGFFLLKMLIWILKNFIKNKNRRKKTKKGEGGFLAFNSFSSTSLNISVADGFINENVEQERPIRVVFIITVDPSVSSAIYADSVQLSLMDRIRQEIEGSTPLYKFGALMIKVGQFNKTKETYHKFKRNTNDEEEKANIDHQLEFIEYKQGNTKEALFFYQDILNKIYDKSSPNEAILATCYNNIASVYDHQDDCRQAVERYEKALEIHKQSSIPNHPDVATLHNNIDLRHMKSQNNKEAYKSFQNIVNIGTKDLPANHTDLTTYQNHLKPMSEKLNKYN